jgi:hypothetical protein
MAYQDDKAMTKMGRNVHVPVIFEHYTLARELWVNDYARLISPGKGSLFFSQVETALASFSILITGGVQMTVRDALNRGYNLIGTAIVAISGLTFFPEFFAEDEASHKLDEGVLLLLAIGSIVWYLSRKNKFSRTIVPLLFTGAALVMKIIAMFLLEQGDAADLGDEFAAIILFVIALAFLIWQYVSIRRMAQVAEKEMAVY